jgi:hypothetical protein
LSKRAQARKGERVPSFTPGLELSRLLYQDAVRAVLARRFPSVRYSAARIGTGSEVLGFDTARSADHEWGPRLQLFIQPGDLERIGDDVRAVLANELPKEILGWPTNFEGVGGIGSMRRTDGPVKHRVDVTSVEAWCESRLGFDPRDRVTTFDWLATPSQTLAETVRGAVFHDGLGALTPIRERLRWYPPHVWRFMLASQWMRISEEEAFAGRCDEVGDEIGSRVVFARVARDVMRLVLLMQQQYPPYGKWLGSAFSASALGERLTPAVARALGPGMWPDREAAFADVCEQIARAHNQLGLTEPLDESTRHYYDRPFIVIGADRFAEALAAGLRDTELEDLPLIGNIDQFVDNTAVLTDPQKARPVAAAAFRTLAPFS